MTSPIALEIFLASQSPVWKEINQKLNALKGAIPPTGISIVETKTLAGRGPGSGSGFLRVEIRTKTQATELAKIIRESGVVLRVRKSQI